MRLHFRHLLVRITTLFLLTARPGLGQSNSVIFTNHFADISNAPPGKVPSHTSQSRAVSQRIEAIRADCIQKRRMVCGKVIQVFPEGVVVDSGYMNLLQKPLGRSWLVPGTVLASRPPNIVEGKEPGATCVGLVFLTDYPKSRRTRPKQFDYVILIGYPAGQYTYTSVGSLQRTVRRFSASLSEAVSLNLFAETNETPVRDPGKNDFSPAIKRSARIDL